MRPGVSHKKTRCNHYLKNITTAPFENAKNTSVHRERERRERERETELGNTSSMSRRKRRYSEVKELIMTEKTRSERGREKVSVL